MNKRMFPPVLPWRGAPEISAWRAIRRASQPLHLFFARLLPAFAVLTLISTQASAAQTHNEPTHSQKIHQMMTSPRSDAGDITFDALSAIDRQLLRTQIIVGHLRAQGVHCTSAEQAAELQGYEKADASLQALRKHFRGADESIQDCATLCAGAEARAVNGKSVPTDHFSRMAKHSQNTRQNLEAVNEALSDLADAAKSLDDPHLQRLAESLQEPETAMTSVSTLCGQSIPDRPAESGQKNNAASPSPPAVTAKQNTESSK